MKEGRPSWWGTLLYPAALVSLFLLGQVLLGAAGVPLAQAPTLAAVPAVLALVLSLPARLRRVWGCETPWRRLGLCIRPAQAGRALLAGLGQAALLLALVIAALALAHALQWQPRLSGPLLFNALLLGLGVGLVEELLFRGWLLGELTLHLGARRALLLQAAVFALVHLRFNLKLGLLLGLLSGLLLLGMALGLRRRVDGGALWGAIGLHGGLVGGWFVLLQGVVVANPAAPSWLMGPANPIGGLAGLLGLALLVGWLLRKEDSRPCSKGVPVKSLQIYH